MDAGFGSCVLRHRELAEEVASSLRYFQHDRCFTACFVIMPNHVHAVMKPLGSEELEDVLQSIKRFSSRKLNALLGRGGKLWEQESYDQIIRDERHLYRVIQYIGQNPQKAGLPPSDWVRWIAPEWENVGWAFLARPE